MLWCLAAANVLGIVIGLRFRAPALIAATLAVAVLCGLASFVEGLSDRITLTSTLLLILALQAGFLIGLGLPALWRGSGDRP